MKAKDLMATDVKCCAEYNTLNTAAQMMWEHDIGCVPVVVCAPRHRIIAAQAA